MNFKVAAAAHQGIEGVLGDGAWQRLPRAVRARFSEPCIATVYHGEFEIVRASTIGRLLSWVCRLIGTPIAPRTGMHIPASVHVGPRSGGVEWRRHYQWPDGARCTVMSTKTIDSKGRLIEKLPAGLCMPLDVYERGGALHFLSRGYYFEFANGLPRITLPGWASPGTTHVEHIDEANGWFRFTMTVTHPLFGELFFQTGRFCDARS